jgi:hypothetical protein
MRRKLLFLLTILGLAAAVAVPVALADNPHWINASSSIDNDGILVCSFKEAGLGTISATNVTCSADASAVYYCVNGGNNHPQAANKETVTEPVSGGGSFPVRNGQTTGDIVLSPPGAGDFSCPPGQRLELGEVHYTNIVLHGEAGDLPLDNQDKVLLSF